MNPERSQRIATVAVIIAVLLIIISIVLVVYCATRPATEIRIPIPQTVVVVVTATPLDIDVTAPVVMIPTEAAAPSATAPIGSVLEGTDACQVQRVKALLDTFIFSEASAESATRPLRKGTEVQVVGAYDRNNEVWLAVMGTDGGFVQQTQVSAFQCIAPA